MKSNSLVEIELGKIPPQSIELEEAVLGGILLEGNEIYEDISSQLNTDLFYKEAHRNIYEAIFQLAKKKAAIDIITCREELTRMDKLETIGGAVYLSELSGKVASTANIGTHIMILSEKALRRKQIKFSYETIERAYDNGEDVFKSIEKDTANVQVLNDYVVGETAEFDIASSIKRTYDFIRSPRKNEYQGYSTGNGAISEAIGGFQKPDIIVLGGRPSEGKTDRMLNFACSMAENNIPVAIFSLETTVEHKINTRLLARYSGISNKIIAKGNFEYDTDKALFEAQERIATLPLYIFDQSTITSNQAIAICRKLKKRKGVKMGYFDYLQLITPNAGIRGNREQEVAQISRSFKIGAKDLDMPFMLLSQLSRGAERDGKVRRPVVPDLRESGAIEQDADTIMLEFFPSKHWTYEEYKTFTPFSTISEENYPYLMETIIGKTKVGDAPITICEYYHKATSTFTNNPPYTMPISDHEQPKLKFEDAPF